MQPQEEHQRGAQQPPASAAVSEQHCHHPASARHPLQRLHADTRVSNTLWVSSHSSKSFTEKLGESSSVSILHGHCNARTIFWGCIVTTVSMCNIWFQTFLIITTQISLSYLSRICSIRSCAVCFNNTYFHKMSS